MSRPPHHTPFSLVLALGLTMMIGPFSLDTYLPAFPSMGEDLGVPTQSISLTVAFYIAALAFSQLLGGALSDRFGRRNILVSGLAIYIVASWLISMADSLTLMLLGRVVQAFGAGWGIVSVPALVRDRVSGKDAAKLFSMLGFIIVLAPAIAPSVGSALLTFGSWRTIFQVLAIYGALLIPLSYYVIFRNMPKAERKPLAIGMLRRYQDVLQVRQARPYILWQAAAFSIIMLFVSNASFIYQEHFGQSERAFSLLFAANIVAMLCYNLLNRFLIGRHDSHQILQWATGAQILGIVLLILATVSHAGLLYFVPAMMITVGAMGAISPCIQSCFLEYFPQNGGSAAAVIGATQFGASGLLSALSTRLPHSLLAVIMTMAACSAITLAIMRHAKTLPEPTISPESHH